MHVLKVHTPSAPISQRNRSGFEGDDRAENLRKKSGTTFCAEWGNADVAKATVSPKAACLNNKGNGHHLGVVCWCC